MNMRVIVIEEPQNGQSPNQKAIVDLFEAAHWIRVSSNRQTYKLLDTDERLEVPDALRETQDITSFFSQLLEGLSNGSTIFRVRNPVYPLDKILIEEIQTQFPENLYDYVLSTMNECGLSGFFVERMNNRAIREIAASKTEVMPDGTFNGMRLRNSGRHWASLELRRFYLENHFEDLFDSPNTVAINCISQCNKSCLKCQYHSPRLKKRYEYGPPMSLNQFSIILDKLKAFERLTTIVPTISGEPLLHPQMDKIVRIIRGAGYNCSFFTNGSLLSGEISKRLLDAGINSITFSVDSADPLNYRKLQGGDLHETEKNILAFREEMSRQRGSFNGAMIFVVSDQNQSEIEAYRRKWLSRGFKVCFSAQHDVTANYRPFFVHKKWSPKRRMPCFALWHCLYLSETGRVLSCGAMANINCFKESLFDLTAYDLWRSKPLRRHRKQQLEGITPDFCKECSCWTGMMNTWISENRRLECHSQGVWIELPDQPNNLA